MCWHTAGVNPDHKPAQTDDIAFTMAASSGADKTFGVNPAQEPVHTDDIAIETESKPLTAAVLQQYLTSFEKNIIENTKLQIEVLQSSMDESKQIARDTKQITLECRDDQSELASQFYKLVRENVNLRNKLKMADDKLRSLENYTRKLNVIVDGLEDSPTETRAELLTKIRMMLTKLGCNNPDQICLGNYHRLKSSRKGAPRPVIVRFLYADDKYQA